LLFVVQGSEFYFDPEIPADPSISAQYEKDLAERMKNCQTRSVRLEKARQSPKAKEFFQRGPNAKEGYEHLWVAAVDNVSFQPLKGNLRDYGVEFADNFGDFADHSAYDGLHSVEDMAAWKARQVYKVTGLPVIASRTGFEIEPVPASSLTNFKDTISSSTNKAAAATRMSNSKVLSGYRINDIAMHVDYLTEALRPLSEPTRVTRFTTCLCFYDGKMELFEYGVCDVDMHFCNSMRTFIPLSQAMNAMVGTLKMTFGLEYQQFLRTRMDDAIYGMATPGSASMKLRDRVLRDGRVLPNDIIDVSAFMDSQVDVNLMDDCAKELAERFIGQKPSKILTVATTGLVIALPMAKYLQVPAVYARKERNVVMADTFSASYSSKTVGKNRQLLVSKSHLDEDDRVLIVDDFLSSGASQEALLRIISDAGAEAVGVAVLLEKVYDSGRRSLSGFDVPIQSLCRVASVKGGVIQLVEEEGYDKMK
jgi:xanthine phosphoribosyltransferase